MPGTLLLDDYRQSVEDQLKQHAQGLGQAFQVIGNAVPQVQAPDPQQVLQELQSHAQQAVEQTQTGITQFAQQRQQQVADVGQQLQDYAQSLGASQPQPQPLGASGVTQFAQPQPQQPPPSSAQPDVLGGASPTQTPQQVSTSLAATSGLGPIDNSSPSAFARSFAPYAQYAAQKLGVDPTWVAAMAGSESNYGKAGGNELFGVKALPGQPGTTMQTHEGEYGGTTQNATFASYDTPKDAVDAWVNLIQNHYKSAVGAQDLPTFIHGLKQGGYFTAAEPEYLGIVKGIGDRIGGDVQAGLQGAGQAIGGAASAVGTRAQQAYQDISQFGDSQLSNAESYAACGPAAAVRFAERFGRNPTLREAVDLAKQVGWTEAGGMAGIGSEQSLLQKLGVPTSIVQGAQWDRFGKEAQTGNPVTISTPGHYFYADGYDPSSGAFHVGRSGTDLKGGSEWMTAAQMEALMGGAQGALFADNPTVPSTSPESSPAYTVGGQRPATRAPMYAGVMQPAAGEPERAPFQVIGDTVGQVVSDLGAAARGALPPEGQSPHPLPGQPGGLVTPPGTYNPPPGSLGGAAASAARQTIEDVGTAARQRVQQGQEELAGGARAAGGAVQDFAAGAQQTLSQVPTAQELGRNVAGLGAQVPEGIPLVSGAAPVVTGIVGGLIGQPGVLDSMATVQRLNAKYATSAGATSIPDRAGGPPLVLYVDPSVMSDEDQHAYTQAMVVVGSMSSPQEIRGAGRAVEGAPALQAARQAVEELRTQFPQMSPGSLAASREGRALAQLEADAAANPARYRPTNTPEVAPVAGAAELPAAGRLDQALKSLDAYPEADARTVRAWATSADAPAADVARTIEQWIAENPRPTTARAAPVEGRPNTGFRAPIMGERPTGTVAGTEPLTMAGAARSLRINPPRPSIAARAAGTTADRLDFLLDRGRYAPPPEAPIPRSPATGGRALATTVAGEQPLSVSSSAGAIDINPSGRVLGGAPPGTTADQLDYLLERGRHAPPDERPTPTALERANTVRLAGLLSSTTTHLVNATGNLVSGATTIPQQVIASGFDAARVGLGGGTRQRYLGEVLPMVKSWAPGVINSVPDALEILRTGVSPQNAGKLEHIGAGFRSDLLPVVGKLLGKRGGAIADSAIEMPLRMLQASDVLFRGGATNAFTNGLAVRKALQEGAKGAGVQRRAADIMAHLERHPEIVKEANDQAARVVFQENRQIPFVGKQAGKALEGSGVLRFAESQLLPFTKTPYNITAQGAGLSPLGWASVAQAARSGNPGLALDRAARASLGTAAFGVALWMGSHGLLTGAYPDDPQVRSTLPTGWREWSVRLPQGDGAIYVPMQNFGAFGWPLAMASIASEAASQGKSTADPDQIAKAVTSMGRYVLDNTFLQGLSDATNALHDPERYGQKLLESEASSFVPYSAMGRQLQRIGGMVNRNPREGMQGIIDAMAATNPLTAGTVPERTNALGQAVSPTVTGVAAAISPVRAEVEQDDPTLKVLRANDVSVPAAPKALNVIGGSVDLTEAEQDQLKRSRGEAIARGVSAVTASAAFQRADAGLRNEMLKRELSFQTQRANEQFLSQLGREQIVSRRKARAAPEPYYLGGAAAS